VVTGFFKKLFNIRDRNEQVKFTGKTSVEKRQQIRKRLINPTFQ
jgi:hypothetical protein